MKNGYSYGWINGQKPHLINNGIRIQCDTENFVPIVVPGLSTSASSCSHHSTFKDTFKTGEALFYIFFKLVFFTDGKSRVNNEARERKDRTESDLSPVLVSRFNVDDRTGKPVVDRESDHEQKG